MIDDPKRIGELLEGTVLNGRPVERTGFAGPPALARGASGSDDVVLFVRCQADEIEASWRAARSLVNETSRWPVATAGWSGSGEPLEGELFSRITGISDLPPTVEDDELDARLRARFQRRDSFRGDLHEDMLRYDLDATVRMFGSAPSLAEMRRNLGSDPGVYTLDRWLFQWEQARVDEAVAPEVINDSYLNWFVPVRQPCCVVLMPSARSWEAGALLDFFGAGDLDGRAVFVSLLQRWHERWGAEIVASFGTMLEFNVSSPPSEPQDLLDLAIEQHLLAPCTTMLPGVHLRHHARVLADRRTWFLHERP